MDNVKITCVNGFEYIGNIIAIDEVEEMYDAMEDELSLETKEMIVGLKQARF